MDHPANKLTPREVREADWYHGGLLDGGRTLYNKRLYHPTGWLHVGTYEAAAQRIDPRGWEAIRGEADWLQHARLYRVRPVTAAHICPQLHTETGACDHADPGSLSFTGETCGAYDAHAYLNEHEDAGSLSLAIRPTKVRVLADLGRHPAWLLPEVVADLIRDSREDTSWRRERRPTARVA